MIPSEANDLYLIEEIKRNQSSVALQELIERHTGIYLNSIRMLTTGFNFEKQDLIDHKQLNIYQAALSFDPSKKMKFSTYVGQTAKWKCLNIINTSKSHCFEELTPDLKDKEKINDLTDFNEFLDIQLKSCANENFIKIFKYRHEEESPLSWIEIGKKLGLSHEGCRKIYKKNIKIIKTSIQKYFQK